MESVYKQFQINTDSTKMKSLLGTSTFRNLKIELDAPIFSKLRINFNPSHPITHLVTNNNHLILVMSNKILVRIDLLSPNDKEEIDLSKFSSPQSKIHKLFFDPTGQHLLISISKKDCCTPVDVLYLPWKSSMPKVSTHLRDNLVTAVGWNHKNKSDSSTGQILIGTSNGLIIEMELSCDDKLLQSNFEKFFKQVLNVSMNEEKHLITSLDICCSSKDNLHYLVFCSTPGKLTQFSGYVKSHDEKPLFAPILQYNTGSHKNFVECSNIWEESMMQFYFAPHSSIPQSFVWMVGHSICTGEVSWTETLQNSKYKFKPLPEQYEFKTPPCGYIVTQFHMLIVYPHEIIAICLLNNQVIFKDSIPEECGKLVGISKDQINGTIWVFAEKGIFKYKVGKEDQNIWQIYLEQSDFQLARKYCSNDKAALSKILTKEAENLFKKEKYLESAALFSQTTVSFEEICLKFIDAKVEDALIVYLREKLNKTKMDEQSEITILVMWIFELYLKKLGVLRDTARRNTEEYRLINIQLNEFLSDVKVRLCVHQNSNAIYSLLDSHDDQDNYVGVALTMKDFNRVVLHLMSHERYFEALEVMSTQCSDKLFYQHTSALLKVMPSQTIDALIAQGRLLDPLVLLPTLIHAHSSYGRSGDVLKYLEFCIDKLDTKAKPLHNFLITLYCSHSSDKLLAYLKLQGDDISSVNYDVRYALKECSIAGYDEASVHILTTMGLYQEAVEMALKVNTTLAKAIANRTKYNPDLCKNLWLVIAAHVVQKEQDVSRAMEVLKECSLIKIEDILPFFPDFVTIDQFKNAICSSLQDYNEHIQNLKEEMEDATKTAANIHNDIKKFKQKHFVVKAHDRCSECNFPLMTRSFYLFPCSHKFHQDCLTDSVMNSLSASKQKHLSDLKGKLISLASSERDSKGIDLWTEREQIRQKIDSVVANECLYCGEIAVNSIDMPFIDDDEWKTVFEEWQ